MRNELRGQVLEANLELAARGLVHASFANVSAVAREGGVVAIKPSGVPHAQLRNEDVALLRLESGDYGQVTR